MSKTVIAMTPKTIEELNTQEMAEYRLAEELSTLEVKDYSILTGTEKERLMELRQLQPRQLFSHVNENMLVWIVCFIVLIYAIAGGLKRHFTRICSRETL